MDVQNESENQDQLDTGILRVLFGNRIRRSATFIAAIVAFIAAAIAIYDFIFPPQKPKPLPTSVAIQTEIIIDSSEAMSAINKNQPKIHEAAGSIISKLDDLSSRDNIALRSYGGACGKDDSTRLLVPFGQNNKEKIKNKLERIIPSGKATMALAVREAVADFNDAARYPGTTKRIVMVIGSCGDCKNNPMEKIDKRVNNTKIEIDWGFVAIDPDRDCRGQLAHLAQYAQVVVPTNGMQVRSALNNLMAGTLVENFPPDIVSEKEDSLQILSSKSLTFIVNAVDPNMTLPELTAPSLPLGASLTLESPDRGVFEWTPNPGQIGKHFVILKADDGKNETTKTIAIEVLKPETLPPIIPAPVLPTPVNIKYSGLIEFDLGRSDITINAEKRLAELVSELRDMATVTQVNIVGHTCSLGATRYNQDLGLSRALRVKNYLMQKEIPAQVISVNSRGELAPKYDNHTEAGRKQNRRIDIEFVLRLKSQRPLHL